MMTMTITPITDVLIARLLESIKRMLGESTWYLTVKRVDSEESAPSRRTMR